MCIYIHMHGYIYIYIYIYDVPNRFILLAFSAWVIPQEQNKDIFKLI